MPPPYGLLQRCPCAAHPGEEMGECMVSPMMGTEWAAIEQKNRHAEWSELQLYMHTLTNFTCIHTYLHNNSRGTSSPTWCRHLFCTELHCVVHDHAAPSQRTGGATEGRTSLVVTFWGWAGEGAHCGSRQIRRGVVRDGGINPSTMASCKQELVNLMSVPAKLHWEN